jgi:hypothetical protein
MPTKTYTGITPAIFASLCDQVGQAGGTIVYDNDLKNGGSFCPPAHPEIRIDFVYDGSNALVLKIQDDAWYETAGEVWSGLAPYLPAQPGA